MKIYKQIVIFFLPERAQYALGGSAADGFAERFKLYRRHGILLAEPPDISVEEGIDVVSHKEPAVSKNSTSVTM